MLSPNLNDTKTLLTTATNEIVQLDSYAYGCQNTTVGVLADDPDWLTSVRSELASLTTCGNNWFLAKPDLWSQALTQFIDYASSIEAISSMQAAGKLTTSAEWVDVLKTVLLPVLEQAQTSTASSDTQIQDQYDAFKAIQPSIENSINQGWEALADEEEEMVKIAAAIGSLQSSIQSMQSDIDSTMLSDGKSYVSSAVSISYKLLSTAGDSIPFLSVASMAITIGKGFYDLITETDQIVDDLEEIAKLQLEATEEAQAAAGTKSVLQMLYQMEIQFTSIQDTLPAITAMWTSESEKLSAVIEGLEAGADPDSYLELTTLSTASANWQALSEFTQDIVALKSEYGSAVTLEPGQAPSESSSTETTTAA